jgi:hypothetical protein
MNEADQTRLAGIRAQNFVASAIMDTTTWESTFFLRIIDQLLEKNKCEN